MSVITHFFCVTGNLPTIIMECAMHYGRKTAANVRSTRPAAPFAARSKRWKSGAACSKPNYFQNAQNNYQRYLALGRAEALNGNTVGSENYYQHAEHYLRSLTSDHEF
jgi:Domain of unknown function (DUF4167)